MGRCVRAGKNAWGGGGQVPVKCGTGVQVRSGGPRVHLCGQMCRVWGLGVYVLTYEEGMGVFLGKI